MTVQDLTDGTWKCRVDRMTEKEKLSELSLDILLGFCHRVTYLVKEKGVALTSPPHPRNVLFTAMNDIADFDMVDTLLALGASAHDIEFADLQYLFYEDEKRFFDLILRLKEYDWPIEARAQGAYIALKEGRSDVAYKLKHAYEDPYRFLNLMMAFDTMGVCKSMKTDDAVYQKIYQDHFKQGLSLAKLQSVIPHADGDMTGYTLAVRAGYFDQVIDFFDKNKHIVADPKDFTARDGRRHNVTELLRYRKKDQMIYHPALWHHNVAGFHRFLQERPARFVVDETKAIHQLNQYVLQHNSHSKKKNNNRFKL